MNKEIKNQKGFSIAYLIIIGGLLVGAVIYFGGQDNEVSINTETIKEVKELSESYASKYVSIKYRDGRVDIANPMFEYFDTKKSSFVRGAWYDKDNKYMIINLSGTNYQYCSLSKRVWDSFKNTSSFGSYYNSSIKGKYDCRLYSAPEYEQ